jgi:hypothetical protein
VISSSLLEGLANTTKNFAVAALLLAVLTAIFMQALYEIGLRGFLQRRWVRGWLEQRLMRREVEAYDPEVMKKVDVLISERQQRLKSQDRKSLDSDVGETADGLLNYLEGRGEEKSIYSLNYQQLCGQIASRVQREIDEPNVPQLLLVFAADMSREEIKDLGTRKRATRSRKRIQKADAPQEIGDSAALRDRVLFHAEKGVDDLQIKLGRLWRQNNYLLNLLFSLGLTLFLSLLSTQFQFRFTELSWVLLSVGGAGGLVAPIASNLLERIFYPR